MGASAWIILGLSVGFSGLPDPGDTTASSRVRLDFLRADAGPWDRLFGESFLRVRTPSYDRVYDFEEIEPSLATWTKLLLGQPVAQLEVRDFETLASSRPHFEVRSLRLPPAATESLVAALERRFQGREPFHLDPLRDTGTKRLATLLDEALRGDLSRQAGLAAAGSPRDWALLYLNASPARWVAELLIRPDLRPRVQWDQTVFPIGLEHVLERGTTEGVPLVSARSAVGTSPNQNDGWPSVLVIFVPLALLGLLLPRLVSFVGAGLVGGLGLATLVLDLGLDWTYFDAWPVAALLLPTHLLLAALAPSRRIWRATHRLRVRYIALALLVAVSIAVATIAGALAAPLPTLIVAIGLDLCLLLGYLRTGRRGLQGSMPSVPPRAISQIERTAPYVGSGVRLR